MKKAFLILLTFGLTQASCAQKTMETKAKEIDQLMERYVKLNKFNGAILVAQEGRILFEKGYGFKNAKDKTLNDVNSIFQIYSITKSVTATVIFKLIEANKLSLSDRLSKFYPFFPKGDSITIEHLLTHTSGIYNYTNGNNMPDHSEKSMLTFLATKSLDFSPGSSWRYNNSGYSLLGFIIGQVTGDSYEKAVRLYIFDPLGMTQSGFDFKNLSNENKTTGYSVFSEEVKREVIPGDSTGPFAAGAIYSTVGDLYKFHRGLLDYKIITRKSLEKAFSASKVNTGYGHGWQLGSYSGKTLVFHGGGADGFRTNFSQIPGDNLCVVLLNNHENANAGFITSRIYDILFDKTIKLPTEIKLKKNELTKFVGTFVVGGSRPLTLYTSIVDGRLAIQVSGQTKTVLLAQTGNTFSQEEAEAIIEFPMEDKRGYNTLIVNQPGQDLHAKRIFSTWGLIGNATPKGWNENIPDIEFTEYSKKKGLWVLNNIKLDSGEIKFRYNNDWNLNYGDDNNDKLLEMHGKNIKIAAGTYNIILDFSGESSAKYDLQKSK